MIKLNAGFSRKVGEPNDGSRGASVNVELELESGLIGDPDASNLNDILAQLKSACAAGGTVNDGKIEIQGDHRNRAMSILQDLGYLAKLSGG